MEYHNSLPPEGINTTRVHPLKQFVQLMIGAVVLVILLVIISQFFGSFLAKRIPFSFETAVVAQMDIPFSDPEKYTEMKNYLNDLAQRLSADMPMPEGMSVTVHYDPDDVFNAYATVGGNLFFYRGLLEYITDENTLAMVMAHEIAHVLHRDPIASMGGGVVSSLALMAMTGSSGTAGSMLSEAGALTSVQFTRNMEVDADTAALKALYANYGHVQGSVQLFTLFKQAREEVTDDDPSWLEGFVSTHPLDQDRIDNAEKIANRENWSLVGELTPLPSEFEEWLYDY